LRERIPGDVRPDESCGNDNRRNPPDSLVVRCASQSPSPTIARGIHGTNYNAPAVNIAQRVLAGAGRHLSAGPFAYRERRRRRVLILVVTPASEPGLSALLQPLLMTSAIMTTVGLLACVVPARRALRIHPTDALKDT
jgi:hypothetical protein